MKRFTLCLCLFLLLVPGAVAQTPEATPQVAKTKKAKVDPVEKERRETALRLVKDLADEARAFRSEPLRARVQMRAADILWEEDQERARALFLRAWDAAESADREAQRQFEEQLRAAQGRGEGFAGRRPSNLRNEVLRTATRRDRALGEELLAKLEEPRKPTDNPATDIPANTDDNPSELPPALSQRLQAAAELLETGNIERALEFADPGLATVTMPGLHFLSRLRLKNAQAADQRYSALVARAANAPNTNANSVSLLSSYIFTPGLYMTVSPQGGMSSNWWGQQPAIDAPALRTAFLNFAAQVLLRPLPPLDDPNAAGRRKGVYLVTTRLLPLFEQFAPDHAAALQAQIAAVAADVPADTRDPRNPWLTRGLVPQDAEQDGSEQALERAERAKDPAQRDTLYASAALSLQRKDRERAYNIADKISDTELRRNVRSYMDFESLGQALRQKNGADALSLARKGDLTHIQRVWGLTEAAHLLKKTDAPKAAEVLEEAAVVARRISGSETSRVSGLIGVATRFYELDRARAWEYLNEAVKAANSNDGYSGEDNLIEAGVQAKNFAFVTNSSVESFDLAGLFRTLAKEDLNRAVQTAKGFTQERPRATALLAVARQVLSKGGAENRREAVREEAVEN